MTNPDAIPEPDTQTDSGLFDAFTFDRASLRLGECSRLFCNMAQDLRGAVPKGPGRIAALQHLLASRNAALTAITDSLRSEGASQGSQDVSREGGGLDEQD